MSIGSQGGTDPGLSLLEKRMMEAQREGLAWGWVRCPPWAGLTVGPAGGGSQGVIYGHSVVLRPPARRLHPPTAGGTRSVTQGKALVPAARGDEAGPWWGGCTVGRGGSLINTTGSAGGGGSAGLASSRWSERCHGRHSPLPAAAPLAPCWISPVLQKEGLCPVGGKPGVPGLASRRQT